MRLAFTLLELLVVVIIVSVLIVLTIVLVQRSCEAPGGRRARTISSNWHLPSA